MTRYALEDLDLVRGGERAREHGARRRDHPARGGQGGERALMGAGALGFLADHGVLLDTIIVRSVLVTALNLDLGNRIWWPSRLARQSGRRAEHPGDVKAPVAR
jgi:hypothetical protein